MRLPLHKALQAAYLMTSSKKGVSAHQLHRFLEITYKSAWFWRSASAKPCVKATLPSLVLGAALSRLTKLSGASINTVNSGRGARNAAASRHDRS